MIYWQLFLSFLQIGMFSFGGGYAALPLIQEQVVTQAVEIGIYRPDYNFPDDARTDCSQFRDVCRHPAGRLFGSAGGDIWLYFAVVHPGNGAVLSLFKIP